MSAAPSLDPVASARIAEVVRNSAEHTHELIFDLLQLTRSDYEHDEELLEIIRYAAMLQKELTDGITMLHSYEVEVVRGMAPQTGGATENASDSGIRRAVRPKKRGASVPSKRRAT